MQNKVITDWWVWRSEDKRNYHSQISKKEGIQMEGMIE